MTLESIVKNGWLVSNRSNKFLDADGKWRAVPVDKAHIFDEELGEVRKYLNENMIGECFLTSISVIGANMYFAVKILRTSEDILYIDYKK